MDTMKKLFSDKALEICIILLIILQPLIDMDYLAYSFLHSFGIPRISTVVRFVIIPLLVIWTFFKKDQNKKKTILFAGIYAICLGGYFILHCRQANSLYDVLEFTTNFKFTIYQELVYLLTLVLPFGVVYCIYHLHLKEKTIQFITTFLASIISFPILIGDLFVFGQSTYFGYTVANFFTWFTDIYERYHPRTLASKFFFNEGNTMGILMFMLLPLLYYFFSKEENKNKKIYLGVLIGVHSLSMMILATRVATYGAILIPVAFLVLYLFDSIVMKNRKIQKNVILLTICIAAVGGLILNRTPAIQNQKVDATNDVALITNDFAQEGLGKLNDEDLVPGTTAYNNYYIFAFEQYGIRAKYASSIPSMYYVDWYNYKFDPKFWVDVINLDVYDRVSGRQIQTLFMNYKWAKLSASQKILGMGYSTFMNGSIILEQDFKQQIYTLGYAGMALTIMPWLLILAFGAVLVLRRWKKLLRLDIMVYALSLVAAIGSAYMSGHTLDQFVSTTFMALLTAILLNQCIDANKKEN